MKNKNYLLFTVIGLIVLIILLAGALLIFSRRNQARNKVNDADLIQQLNDLDTQLGQDDLNPEDDFANLDLQEIDPDVEYEIDEELDQQLNEIEDLLKDLEEDAFDDFGDLSI